MAEQDDVLYLIEDAGTAPKASTARKWKVAVIDDDPAVHEGTRFALSDYELTARRSKSCRPIRRPRAAS